MLTDGTLMRLGKDDFNTLLNEPMLHWVATRRPAGSSPGRRWARRASAERVRALPLRRGPISVPLYFVRLKLKTLDPAVPYVVWLRQRPRSSAAGLHLSERGFRHLRAARRSRQTDLADALKSSRGPGLSGRHGPSWRCGQATSVGRLVPAERAGEVGLDLPLSGAAVLLAELTPMPAVRCPARPSASSR